MTAKKVQELAQKLDSLYPGWAKSVDLNEFNIAYSGICVLSWALNLESDDPLCKLLNLVATNQAFFGYSTNLNNNKEELAKLNGLWMGQIQKRNSKDSP